MNIDQILARVLSKMNDSGPVEISSEILPGRQVVLLPAFFDGHMGWRESYIALWGEKFYVCNRCLPLGSNREVFTDLDQALEFLAMA